MYCLQAVWEESFSDIGDAIKERTTALEKRDVSFSSERDTTQRDAEKANKQTFFSVSSNYNYYTITMVFLSKKYK